MTTTYLRRWAIVATVTALVLAGAIVAVSMLVARNVCIDRNGTPYGVTCFIPIPTEEWMRYSGGDAL